MLASNLVKEGQVEKYSKAIALPNILSIEPIIGNKGTKFKRISLGDHEKDYISLGFVSCFQNTLKTRLKCVKCNGRSKIFKTTKSLAMHLTGDVHEHEFGIFPTLESCIKLLEMHSLMLQMEMLR